MFFCLSGRPFRHPVRIYRLPVQARVDYKLSTICHNFFSGSSPAYLSDLLTLYTPSRQLRSSADTRTLRIPHVKTKTFGQRSFSYFAPKQWNSLPSDIRHIQSSRALKTVLKTHLYKQHSWFQIQSSFLTSLTSFSHPVTFLSLRSRIFVFVCVCACVCWCMSVCVCVCVCVCLCVCLWFARTVILFLAYVYICRFTDFVKRDVLTLVYEILRYRNYHYYYYPWRPSCPCNQRSCVI